jgi:hypothetical protein
MAVVAVINNSATSHTNNQTGSRCDCGKAAPAEPVKEVLLGCWC